MKLSDIARYGLWLGIAATADANRREYNMATTWLPHFLTNSLSLLLPDLTRVLFRDSWLRQERFAWPGDREASSLGEALATIRDTLITVVRDNPGYTVYVTPLALGYILSHPRFNIYKGDWAEKRLARLVGLDALPHAATALCLTTLVYDTIHTGSEIVPPENPLAPFLRWSDSNPALISMLALGLLTLIWEGGEYRIHVHELALRGGDPVKINMQWSVRDTVNDSAANFAGWALAVLYNLYRQSRNAKHSGKVTGSAD